MRTVEELREMIIKKQKDDIFLQPNGEVFGDFGEIICYYIHELNMPFKILAEHFNITLDELAEVIADHIRRL